MAGYPAGVAPMSTAILFHQATKYAPETIGGLPDPDWAAAPPVWKEHAGAPLVELGPHLPIDPNPFAARLVCEDAGLSALSRLIYFTYGVTGAIAGGERATYLRAAPSAGGLYPAELYVAVRDLPGVSPGLYGYQPLRHALALLEHGGVPASRIAAACYGDAAVAAAPWLLVVSGVFARSRWRYHERAYRRILLDVGHLLGNAQVAANAIGLRHHLSAAFCDDRLNAALGLAAGEEGALAVFAPNAPGEPERPAWRVLPSPVGPSDAPPPLLDALHRASRCPADRPRAVLDGDQRAEAVNGCHGQAAGLPVALGQPGHPALAGRELSTILARRSTRRFRPAVLPRAAFARILAAAYDPCGSGLGPCPSLDAGGLQSFVAVVAVEGIEPGVYYLAPCGLELRPVRPGLTREELAFLCLGQELGRDAAAAVIHVADLDAAVHRQGDRAYRYLHLDAGLIGERMGLAALAEGGGTSGIGGFFDDHVTEILGLPREQAVLYLTVLGVPA